MNRQICRAIGPVNFDAISIRVSGLHFDHIILDGETELKLSVDGLKSKVTDNHRWSIFPNGARLSVQRTKSLLVHNIWSSRAGLLQVVPH